MRRAALAIGRFAAWWELAGARSKDAFRAYPTGELRKRFASLRVALAGCEDAIQPAARRSLESIREGIRSELQETTANAVSFGVFFVDEVGRLAELIKLYAREAGWTDSELTPRQRREVRKNCSDFSRET